MSCATTRYSQSDESTVLPAASRCSYAFKFCNNPRALKTTGELHKLCEFHRQKANLNQKRLQERRRKERSGASTAARPQRRCHSYKHQTQAQPLHLLQSEQRPQRHLAPSGFHRAPSFADVDAIIPNSSSTAIEVMPARKGTTRLEEASMATREPYEIRL